MDGEWAGLTLLARTRDDQSSACELKTWRRSGRVAIRFMPEQRSKLEQLGAAGVKGRRGAGVAEQRTECGTRQGVLAGGSVPEQRSNLEQLGAASVKGRRGAGVAEQRTECGTRQGVLPGGSVVNPAAAAAAAAADYEQPGAAWGEGLAQLGATEQNGAARSNTEHRGVHMDASSEGVAENWESSARSGRLSKEEKWLQDVECVVHGWDRDNICSLYKARVTMQQQGEAEDCHCRMLVAHQQLNMRRFCAYPC
ncbi:unnamed protein product [Closterium sp. NIES-64]|nr:unnamed protein product [Closterium sp. NIES-64]